MCSVERWVVSLDDAETFDFGGAFIPAYEGRLESEGWKAVDMGSAVGRHGGVYWKGRDPWERRHLFVDASGIVAHMRCRAARSGLTATERRRLFDGPAPYGPALPKTRPSHPADGRKTRRTGPEAIQAVVDFADVDDDRLDALADEELMDPGQLPRRRASRLGRGRDSRDSPARGGRRGRPIHHGWLTTPWPWVYPRFCIALSRMFNAALWSALSLCPQRRQSNLA